MSNIHARHRPDYNYFRDYDAATGRYVESDPMGLEAGTSTFGYVSANPLLNSDPWGLMGFGGGGAAGANSKNVWKSCPAGPCPNPITITFQGPCSVGDVSCQNAMRAAGMPGRHAPERKTYSLHCILTFGIGLKATSSVGLTIAANSGPEIVRRLGGGPSTQGVARGASALLNNPAAIGIGALFAFDELLELCECK